MTREALEILLERISTWPEDAQEEFVRSLESIEQKYLGPYRLSDDERKSVQRGLMEMRERRLADDDAVAAVFNRYRARGSAGLRPRSPKSARFLRVQPIRSFRSRRPH
jgi:hypothetical protein